jgi:hypothetical protein
MPYCKGFVAFLGGLPSGCQHTIKLINIKKWYTKTVAKWLPTK